MGRSYINRRSWDAAIRAVQNNMLELARSVPLTDDQDRILTAASFRCEELTSRKHFVWVATTGELAKKYALSLRTLRYWRRAGCPFAEGQWRVLAWLAARRYVPAGTKKKFARHLERARWCGLLRGLQGCLADARQVKLAYKLNGKELPADDWLRHFRCPKGS
jgi:hypothetical protein